MKATHKNLGEVEVLGPPDANGRTPCRTKDGQTIDASTAYLTPINEPTDGPNTGAGGGD
jgi:hypothetical protein